MPQGVIIVNRDITIDTLRGLAIFTMVAANTAGAGVLAPPHPFWFRLYGSFAAPLFILISGMMVAFTAKTKAHGLKYFFVRGAMIIAVGALIDVLIWRIYPFTAVDVLYPIGISLPLAYLFLRLNTPFRWVVVILIFLAVTPVLQHILGYSNYPAEFTLSGERTIENQAGIFNSWIVDGWFPIFPWLGFSFLGVNLAQMRWNKVHTYFGKIAVLLIGICIQVSGSIIWWLYPGSLLTRAGYSELFYPPTPGYVMSAIGLIVILFAVVDWKPSVFVYKPLQALGESALFMYLLHLVLIEFIILPWQSQKSFQTFFFIYIVLSFFLILIAYGLRASKSWWKDRPFIARFLLGS